MLKLLKKVYTRVARIINIERVYKNVLILLFTAIMIAAISFLFLNNCSTGTNSQMSDIKFSANIVNDTSVMAILRNNIDSTYAINLFDKKSLVVLINPELLGVNNPDSSSFVIIQKPMELSTTSLNQEQFIKIITFLFSVFTAIFGLFIFFVQNNLNKAEKIKNDFQNEKTIALESIKNTSEEFDRKGKQFEEKGLKYQSESKILFNKSLDMLTKSLKETRHYSDMMFLLTSQFYPEDSRPAISLLPDIIGLWEINRVKFAAMKLRAIGDKSCLLFLDDRYNFYKSQGDILSTEAANYIKEAIDEIKLRNEEQG